MYKNFCRNLKNYIEINKNSSKEEFRIKIIEPFKVLADIDLYHEIKGENSPRIQEVNNLVYQINKEKDKYHPFKQFSEDLWLCGFDSEKSEAIDKSKIDEQLKILKLLLGTQYWIN